MQKLEFKSLREAAKYAHVSSVAVYRAIRNGKLHAVKKRWQLEDFQRESDGLSRVKIWMNIVGINSAGNDASTVEKIFMTLNRIDGE